LHHVNRWFLYWKPLVFALETTGFCIGNRWFLHWKPLVSMTKNAAFHDGKRRFVLLGELI